MNLFLQKNKFISIHLSQYARNDVFQRVFTDLHSCKIFRQFILQIPIYRSVTAPSYNACHREPAYAGVAISRLFPVLIWCDLSDSLHIIGGAGACRGRYFLVTEQESTQRSQLRGGAELLAPAPKAALP